MQTRWLLISAALVTIGCGDKDAPALPEADADTDTDTDSDTDSDTDADADADTDADLNTAFGAFVEPDTATTSADGAYDLHLAPAEIAIDGQRYCVRAYNGTVPGPTIEVPAGTSRSLRVNLHNDFSQMDERIVVGGDGYGTEHCYDFNLTNLHFHGGHVRPDYAVGGDACSGEGCGTNPADGDGLANDYYADHVLIEVPQGTTAQYRYDIDEDHTHDPGLHWYHPHIHGSTAIQVGSGAAGALLVRGDLDALDMFEGTTERLMVFSHLPWQVEDAAADGTPLVRPLEDDEACSEETISINNFLALSQESTPLVNGRYRPQIVSPPGQVERWRMLHGGVTNEMVVGIFPSADDRCESIDFTTRWPVIQVAADGIPFPQSWQRDWIFLAPGYRVEVLVQVPEDGRTLCVVSGSLVGVVSTEELSFDALEDALLFSVAPGTDKPTRSALPSATDIDTQLASIARPTEWTGTVEGTSGVEVSCDAAARGGLGEAQQEVVMVHPAAILQDESGDVLSAAGECEGMSGHKHADYSDADPCACPQPNLNCRNFGPRHAYESEDGEHYRSDRVMTAGESEHWELSATDGHPYHIHVNPFVVCPSGSNKEAPFAHWRDTYFMQLDDMAANDYQPIDLLSKYAEDFTGAFVYHCHKLVHEDEGMMEKIEVCAPGDADCLCLDGETDGDGACITSSAGCYDGDTQCLYAEYMMEGFGPEVLESPIDNADFTVEERNELVDRGLSECCAAYPEFSSEADLVEYLAGLTGLDPTCCPEISGPLLPEHPCAE